MRNTHGFLLCFCIRHPPVGRMGSDFPVCTHITLLMHPRPQQARCQDSMRDSACESVGVVTPPLIPPSVGAGVCSETKQAEQDASAATDWVRNILSELAKITSDRSPTTTI